MRIDRRWWWVAAVGWLMVAGAGLGGCARVRPWQRERLASPAMQLQMCPVAEGQLEGVLEITEGGTVTSAGPGSAGAGCGCH